MKITVLIFSILRDLAKAESIDVEVENETPLVKDVIGIVYERFPDIGAWDGRLLIALNGEYAERETAVKSGDELALMPPVQGG
tara:strand:+ start:1226 stop:1474 length:249 start_codon:yes stop_codon:yes gene_type:complete